MKYYFKVTNKSEYLMVLRFAIENGFETGVFGLSDWDGWFMEIHTAYPLLYIGTGNDESITWSSNEKLYINEGFIKKSFFNIYYKQAILCTDKR